MKTAIIDKAGNVLHIYDGAPHPQARWLNHFSHLWADPDRVDHIEIPDPPGAEGDYVLDTTSDPPAWIPNLPAMRARLLREFEREGFSRVAAIHPPHHVSRLGLLPPGNPEVLAASALIEGIRLAVNEAEDAIELITDAEQLEAFEPTWPE